MPRKIIFLIRDKFGDSVVATSAIVDFIRCYPDNEYTLIMRRAYTPILKFEKNIRVIRYINRPLTYLWVYGWRLIGFSFDSLCVLRGFGGQTARLARAIPATQKIIPDHLPINFPAIVVQKQNSKRIYQPLLQYSIDLLQPLSSDYKSPKKLCLPGLQEKWRSTPKQWVVICPMASETRREIPRESLEKLVNYLAQKHPEYQVFVLCKDKIEGRKLGNSPPFTINYYQDISGLMKVFMESAFYYGVDSGHYHLAVAMGLNCTVFFGPSEPSFVVLENQANAKAIRQNNLGEKFCLETSCQRPQCLQNAFDHYLSQSQSTYHDEALLPECLLRSDIRALPEIHFS